MKSVSIIVKSGDKIVSILRNNMLSQFSIYMIEDKRHILAAQTSGLYTSWQHWAGSREIPAALGTAHTPAEDEAMQPPTWAHLPQDQILHR